MSKQFTPSIEILDRYAQVLVNFALNSGLGVKKGEVVECVVPDVAKPLSLSLQNTLLRAQAHPLIRLIPTGFDRDFFSLSSNAQLTFFPKKYLAEKTKLISHQIVVIAETNPFELKDVDPQKIFLSRNSKKQYRDWLTKKELSGKFTWTIALWGTKEKAQEVGLDLSEYWQQIIEACFLDFPDPIKKWRELFDFQKKTLDWLNHLPISQLKIKGSDVDLSIKFGEKRKWAGGSGRNIPSFECFTSPDWREAQGWIKFNQPLYRFGQIISGVELKFDKGLVVDSTAKQGEKVLKEMLKTKNADKIGEFSLTDKRTSRITHFMAETLFDENIGGPFGNMHLALGMSYKDCYASDPTKLKTAQWRSLGFNDSAEHTDIVSTSDRTVTAILKDGNEKIIYKDGKFALDQ